jgi:hypothetical protein
MKKKKKKKNGRKRIGRLQGRTIELIERKFRLTDCSFDDEWMMDGAEFRIDADIFFCLLFSLLPP